VNKYRGLRKAQDSLHSTEDQQAAKHRERRQSRVQLRTEVDSHESNIHVGLKQTKPFPDLKAAQGVDDKASAEANITKDSDTKEVEIAVEEAPNPEFITSSSEMKPVDDGFGWGSFSTKKKKKKGKASAEETEGIISPSESKQIEDDSGWGSFSAKKDKEKKDKVSTEETPYGEGIISPSTSKPIDAEFDWGFSFSTTKKDKKKKAKRYPKGKSSLLLYQRHWKRRFLQMTNGAHSLPPKLRSMGKVPLKWLRKRGNSLLLNQNQRKFLL